MGGEECAEWGSLLLFGSEAIYKGGIFTTSQVTKEGLVKRAGAGGIGTGRE